VGPPGRHLEGEISRRTRHRLLVHSYSVEGGGEEWGGRSELVRRGEPLDVSSSVSARGRGRGGATSGRKRKERLEQAGLPFPPWFRHQKRGKRGKRG